MKPRHADLLAADLDRETLLSYLDRFMMFYIRTADKLTRTAPWLDNMEGGIDYLRSVIIDDKLGLNAHGRRAGASACRCRLRVDRDGQQSGGTNPLQTFYQQQPARPECTGRTGTRAAPSGNAV